MPGGSLAGENESARLGQVASVVREPAEDDASFALIEPAAETVGHRGGLLHDLLEHVMLVVAQLIFLDLVFEQ